MGFKKDFLVRNGRNVQSGVMGKAFVPHIHQLGWEKRSIDTHQQTRRSTRSPPQVGKSSGITMPAD